MPKFTLLSSNSNIILYLNTYNESGIRLISELFTGDPDSTRIPSKLIASTEFKGRLHLLDIMGESSYKPKQFFNHIPNNQYFLFLPDHIDDIITIERYRKELSRINGTSIKHSDLDDIMVSLSHHYEVRMFSGNSRQKIGVYEKDKRICRFCGKSLPYVSFSQKAHAISESLGNKGLICLEECDECNKHFNETIEQDICNMLHFQLMLKGVKGKKGNPTILGDGISMKNDTSSRSSKGRDTIVINVKELPDSNDLQKTISSFSKKYSFVLEKYTPQNIYKCLCKYVLSLIDSRYLSFFKDTIKWINEPLTKRRLPPVWFYSVPTENVPRLIIMIRKHNHNEIPYCWAILSVAGNQFLFIVPFCSLDKYKFIGKYRVNYFSDGLAYFMPYIKLRPIRLSGVTPKNIKIDFNLEIPPECVEGRDYYIRQHGS